MYLSEDCWRSSSPIRLTPHRWRVRILTFNDAAEIDLAIASIAPNASPKAKENGRRDRERDHYYVPQRHGVTG
jgi:hypothetical protein